jgi:DNA-binding GntR family transcriptional regulator
MDSALLFRWHSVAGVVLWYIKHMSTGDLTDEPMPLRPLGVTTSRSDLVVESIREAILGGTFKPGELLVERRLADLLGVSKTPVREALIVLSRTGLVQTTRNRGVSIRELTHTEARQVYEERLLLEPWASAVRAQADFASARSIMAQLRRIKSDSDLVGLAIHNRRFHRALYAGCANRFVVDSLDGLQDLTTLATVNMVWGKSKSWKHERDEHGLILDACLAGDADQAVEKMRRHIEGSLGRLDGSDAEGC